MNLELLYRDRSSIETNFIKEVGNYIINEPINNSFKSVDWAAIFVEGRFRTSKFEDYISMYSFKRFSWMNYPILLFVSNPDFLDKSVFTPELIRDWNIHIIQIEELNSLNEYSDFCINKLYFLLPPQIEKIVTISPDSMFLKKDWEAVGNNYAYVGAKWIHAPAIEIYTGNEWKPFMFPVRIGNGGGSIRRASLCRRAAGLFSNFQLRERGAVDKFPTEDLFNSVIFNGLGYKMPSLDEIDNIIIDPLDKIDFDNKKSYMFHYFSYINPWKKYE